MRQKTLTVVILIQILVLLLSSCSAFRKTRVQTQAPAARITNTAVSPIPPSAFTPTPAATYTPVPTSTLTPIPSLCANPYQPSHAGDNWEYSGKTSATSAYIRVDTIAFSGDKAFTIDSKVSSIAYTVDYSCSAEGLTTNPIQQYLGALLATPNSPVQVTITTISGISLPAKLDPGNTWQQVASWDGTINGTAANGRAVFEYTAGNVEKITVPLGTFDALRVNLTISIQLTALHIPAGSYDITLWLARDIGMIKSEGTSHIPGVDFSDSLELTRYTPAQ